MKTRSIWTGHLQISLVTIPVKLYSSLNRSEKIAFNLLHKDCHQRLRQQLVCPLHGPVERRDTVKGYQYEKDHFVVLEQSDLENLKLETSDTIELFQFIPSHELDSIYTDTPHFLGPDGLVAAQAYAVIWQALRKARRLGIGRVVLPGKEKLVALRPLEKGFLDAPREAVRIRR